MRLPLLRSSPTLPLSLIGRTVGPSAVRSNTVSRSALTFGSAWRGTWPDLSDPAASAMNSSPAFLAAATLAGSMAATAAPVTNAKAAAATSRNIVCMGQSILEREDPTLHDHRE